MNTILNSEYNLVTKLTTPEFKYKIYSRLKKTKSLRERLVHNMILRKHIDAHFLRIEILQKIRLLVVKVIV